MKEILEKLKAFIKALEEEKGPFRLCTFVLREADRWDFLLSASWLKAHELESYRFIDARLREFLDASQREMISRVVLLDPEDGAVKFLLEREALENGGYKEFPQLDGEELTDRFGFVIKRAYLLRINS
jgi:hypothetical protein